MGLLRGIIITLWLFNIAMENGPFIDDFPIKTSIYKGFSMAMLNNQMVLLLLLVIVGTCRLLIMYATWFNLNYYNRNRNIYKTTSIIGMGQVSWLK